MLGIILRWALAIAIVQFVAYKILDPYYIQFMTTKYGLNLTPIEFGMFVSLSSLIWLILEVPSGVLADRYGRRLAWALGLLSYGIGMIILSYAKNFLETLITATLMGLSYAFTSGSKEAWLYDFVGKEGMRKAYAALYMSSLPLTLLAGIIAIYLSFIDDVRLPILISGLIMLSLGIVVLTYPENKSNNSGAKHALKILYSGVMQLVKSRQLLLLVVSSLFMTLPVWINTAWWITYVVKILKKSITDTVTAFIIVSIVSTMTGILIYKMRSTDYFKLIIVPTLFISVLYLFAIYINVWLAYTLIMACIVSLTQVRAAGISILENELIKTERATTLSLLSFIRSMFWVIMPIIWGFLIQLLGLRFSFVLASLCSITSLVPILIVLSRMREKLDVKGP